MRIRNLKIREVVVLLMTAVFFTPTASAQKPSAESIHFERTFLSWRQILDITTTKNPTLRDEDGVYKGQICEDEDDDDRFRCGLGIYYWDSNDFYFGGFEDGFRSGYGIYFIGNMEDNSHVKNCPGCKIYVGDWSNGEKSGGGTCYDRNGNVIYYGDFKNNKPVGTYPKTGTYSFKFQTIYYLGNSYYIGETNGEKKYGSGIIFWPDGDMYFGSWKDDKRYKKYGIFISYYGETRARRQIRRYQKYKIEQLSKMPKSYSPINSP